MVIESGYRRVNLTCFVARCHGREFLRNVTRSSLFHRKLGRFAATSRDYRFLVHVRCRSFRADLWLSEAVDTIFLWLHFNLSHTGALPWLSQNAGFGESFFDVLTDALHSTRVERAEQALIAVINDVSFDFSFDPLRDLDLVDQRRRALGRHGPTAAP